MNSGYLLALAVILSGCLCSNLPGIGAPATGQNDSSNLTTTTVQVVTTSPTTITTLTTTSSTQRTTTSTVKKATTTSSTSSTTTTTLELKGCGSDADCPPKSYKVCSSNNVMSIELKYTCVQSPEGSYCLGKEKRSIYESCSDSYFCDNATCRRKTESSDVTPSSVTTTSATIKFVMPKQSTTTNTIPPATTCMGRSASGTARSEGDCENLRCGAVGGGRTYTCQFIAGEGDTGHCACK
ncbi:MAG: hypothetical protein V1875_08305 [Candidatus Altiarchaeota archaeon]